MAWIISNSLMQAYESSRCSQELAEESWEGGCSDGKQSAQLNGTHTPLLYCAQDKIKELSKISRSGMTCKPLKGSLGADLLTWYLADSLAQIFPAQEEVKELKERHQECGSTWRESLAKYDHDSHLWKTVQCSLLGDLESFSVTWPRSGTMRNGVAYPRPSLEPTMNATGYGSLLPTPVASDTGHRKTRYAQGGSALSLVVGGKLNPEFTEWMMGWPVGWTDLKPLETDKFQQWLQAHSFS